MVEDENKMADSEKRERRAISVVKQRIAVGVESASLRNRATTGVQQSVDIIRTE